jgi:hypothetical protein
MTTQCLGLYKVHYYSMLQPDSLSFILKTLSGTAVSPRAEATRMKEVSTPLILQPLDQLLSALANLRVTQFHKESAKKLMLYVLRKNLIC